MAEHAQASSADDSRRPPRWLIITLVVLVAVPLAGVAALKAMFPPERLREIAEPQIEKRIARDVQLGEVRLKVFPSIAIRMSDVRVANPSEGFSDRPALGMDALDLRLELLPLLGREFRLSQVRLVAPIVRYEVAADGGNNLTGILASDSAVAEVDDGAPEGSDFDIDDLVVVDGAVVYLDAPESRAARVGFDGRFDLEPGERAGGPLASRGGFRLSEGLLVSDGRDTTRIPDVDVTYRAMLDRDFGRVVVPELAVRTASVALTGEASSRAEGGTRSVRLALASEDFRIPDVLRELPEGMVADTIELDGRARLELRYAGELGDPGPELTGSGSFADVAFATAGRGRLAEAVEGAFSFTTDAVEAPEVAGRLLGRPFEARVRIDALTDPSPAVDGRFTGQFSIAQLERFREGDPLPAEGEVAVAIDFDGPARAVDRWSLSGPVRLSDVAWTSESLPEPARIGAATIQLTGAGVRADAIPVRIGGSDLSLSFSSEQVVRHFLTEESARGPAPLVEFSATSDRLAAADLRRGRPELGYSDLLKARLAGAEVDGRPPEQIAAERYHRPDLTGYRASGTVRVGEWVNPPTNASDVSFRLDLADGIVEISEVAGTVYGGRLSGGADVDLGGDPPYEVAYDLELRGAGAGQLVERWTRLGRALEGIVDVDIEGAAPLDEAFLPITAAFTASGRASFVEGRFEELGLFRALRSHLDLGPERLRGFRDLGGPFAIRDGQFLVRNWTFTTGELQGAVSGGAGLGGLLDLDLAFLVPPELLRNTPVASADEAIGQLLGRIGGGDGAAAGGETGEAVPLRLEVGGTMRDPAFRVDTEALTSSLRGRITGEGRERAGRKAGDLLEEAAGGVLDRLRGAGRDTSAAREDTAEAVPDTAEPADTASADTAPR